MFDFFGFYVIVCVVKVEDDIVLVDFFYEKFLLFLGRNFVEFREFFEFVVG